ncbi:Acid_phosphatase surE [Hexamita inflata]|uniref:Acid phosphatase surE n=1 Tax=Hexamita inflata TaxID=28002 RepID=A0AA86RB77_9EUKA|nr:Acid phosphatase surE [Hexamita inflata]
MLIAITNDDGYNAAGIQAIIEILKDQHEIIVIAPETHMSAKGMSLSVSSQIKFRQYDVGNAKGYIISGTPCDCVKIGLKLIGRTPDLLISGINAGSNTGLDNHYSGTLGAAKEATLAGIPSIAMSNLLYREGLEMIERLKTSINDLIENIVKSEQFKLLPKKLAVVNINFPGGSIKGYKESFVSNQLMFEVDPIIQDGVASYNHYHRTAVEPEHGSDFHIVSEGYISLGIYYMGQGHTENIDIKQIFSVL